MSVKTCTALSYVSLSYKVYVFNISVKLQKELLPAENANLIDTTKDSKSTCVLNSSVILLYISKILSISGKVWQEQQAAVRMWIPQSTARHRSWLLFSSRRLGPCAKSVHVTISICLISRRIRTQSYALLRRPAISIFVARGQVAEAEIKQVGFSCQRLLQYCSIYNGPLGRFCNVFWYWHYKEASPPG